MNMPDNELISFGHTLDLSPQAFGELRRSADIAHDDLQLRARMAEDGYLYLPGLLDVEEVLAARREITDRLAASARLLRGTNRWTRSTAPGATSMQATDRQCRAHRYSSCYMRDT